MDCGRDAAHRGWKLLCHRVQLQRRVRPIFKRFQPECLRHIRGQGSICWHRSIRHLLLHTYRGKLRFIFGHFADHPHNVVAYPLSNLPGSDMGVVAEVGRTKHATMVRRIRVFPIIFCILLFVVFQVCNHFCQLPFIQTAGMIIGT